MITLKKRSHYFELYICFSDSYNLQRKKLGDWRSNGKEMNKTLADSDGFDESAFSEKGSPN